MSAPDETSEPTPLIPSLPSPLVPLTQSYTYHSPAPTKRAQYVLGVDEAGRGPVLGPLVYGVAYCPLDHLGSLEELGFDDSKALTHAKRVSLLDSLNSDPSNLGWSVRVISPECLSNGMLRKPPTNLNKQSQDATVLLIREVLARGVDIAEIYVDALGPSIPYQNYLCSLFPAISITVCPKADSLYKIVGAASVAAKVTRDAWLENWLWVEEGGDWSCERGSGYPSDPKTKAWLQSTLDPTFGFPSIARFSWATVILALEKDGHSVEWIDEGQSNIISQFASAQGRDKGRSTVAKELGLRSVADL